MLALSLLASASAYAPLDAVVFNDVSEVETLTLERGLRLTFQVHRPVPTGYPDTLMRSAIVSATTTAFRRLEQSGASVALCGPDRPIDIFEVSVELLNNSARFPIDRGPDATGEVWGIFEPAAYNHGRRFPSTFKDPAIIALTPHSEYENLQIVYHELAHYWYTRCGLAVLTSIASEDFALAVQHDAFPE